MVGRWRFKCDDEILREYRAPADATYLKCPACVKGHDALGVPVENQNKTLEKISEFYDCEPEKVSITCDSSERIVQVNNSLRCSVVGKGDIICELSNEEYQKMKKQTHSYLSLKYNFEKC